MKKLGAFVLALSMILSVSFAFAESIDLSGMTIEELAQLQNRCQMEIMKSDKWQEVTVPVGLYQIGKEIPAGHWTIKPVDGHTAYVTWGTAIDESGANIDTWNTKFYNAQQITSPTDSYAKYNNVESISWELKVGDYLLIESSSVVFSPFAGVSFGFK